VTVLYVIRHGETHWNVEQRMQGRGDSALTERGRAQAAAHGDMLARLGGVDELLVSPSGRTRETAAILAARLAATGGVVPVSYHEALLERHSGEWEGLTLAEIRARYPEHWAARETDPYFHRPPGGENHADMEVRVGALVDALRARVAGASGERGAVGSMPGARGMAIVTHGVMSRVILKRLLQLAPSEAVSVRHPNGLFYRLEFDGGRVSESYFIDGAGPFAGLLRH
jgi:broad specificity phosphatase PhoE